MSRLDEFALRIEAANCVSNEVMVAIGHDVDEDGDLSFDETAFVFGIDCGSRYLADYAAGRVLDDVDETLRISHRDFDPSWNLAKVVKRGEGEVDAVVTVGGNGDERHKLASRRHTCRARVLRAYCSDVDAQAAQGGVCQLHGDATLP